MSNSILTAAQTARAVNNSFWVNKEQGAVYSIYLWSEFATPNTPVPFALTIKVYTPSGGYYADSRQYRGWIKLDGSILMSNSTDGYSGTLQGDNMIVWADGQVWTRTTIKPTDKIDQYSAQGNLEQAALMNNQFHKNFNLHYPRYQRFFPYGSNELL
jgi:hypothetical protein